MKSNLPCEVVQDLLPSYVDGLTSEKTNKLVEKHVEECNECSSILRGMRSELESPIEIKEEEKQEIDFLKKTREENKKETRKVFLQWAVSFALVAVIWVSAKLFFIGDYLYMGSVNCKVEVKEELNQIIVEPTLVEGDHRVISKVEFEEEDGVVRLRFKAVESSPFHNATVFQSVYQAKEPIQEVSFASRIYWYKGTEITEIASKVYDTCHDYVGDMSANGATARALNMSDVFGNFKNELQTSTEPYGWNMELENSILSEDRKAKERIMTAYGYILLAAVGNLSEVSYEYIVDGQPQFLLVTEAEATEFAGRDIKECGEDLLLLQELIENAKVYGRLYSVVLE